MENLFTKAVEVGGVWFALVIVLLWMLWRLIEFLLRSNQMDEADTEMLVTIRSIAATLERINSQMQKQTEEIARLLERSK